MKIVHIAGFINKGKFWKIRDVECWKKRMIKMAQITEDEITITTKASTHI